LTPVDSLDHLPTYTIDIPQVSNQEINLHYILIEGRSRF